MTAIAPTKLFTLFENKINIYLFGKPLNWSLKEIQQQKDPSVSVTTKTIYLYSGKTKKVFAPIPIKFNAKIAKERDFSQKISLSQKFKILRGTYADGVALKRKGDSFFISSADCPTIIAVGKKTMVCAHAGRESLIDRQRVITKTIGSRKNNSVVDGIIENFYQQEERTKMIKVFVTCGIGNFDFLHPWDHPIFGKYNKKLTFYIIENFGRECIGGSYIKEGRIDLQMIIKNQFVKKGVLACNIYCDAINTACDTNNYGEYVWHSCAREKNMKEKEKRNGVLVVRNF